MKKTSLARGFVHACISGVHACDSGVHACVSGIHTPFRLNRRMFYRPVLLFKKCISTEPNVGQHYMEMIIT